MQHDECYKGTMFNIKLLSLNTSSPFSLAYSKQWSKQAFSKALGCTGGEILSPVCSVPLGWLAGKKWGRMVINPLHNLNAVLFQAAGCYWVPHENRLVRLQGRCLWPPSEPEAEVQVKICVILVLVWCFVCYPRSIPLLHYHQLLWGSQACGLFICCLFLSGELLWLQRGSPAVTHVVSGRHFSPFPCLLDAGSDLWSVNGRNREPSFSSKVPLSPLNWHYLACLAFLLLSI